MITCDKGNVEMEGNLILLEAETIAILRGIRNTLEESCEKKHAEELMQKIFELSAMTREEIEEEMKKLAQELEREIAEHLMK